MNACVTTNSSKFVVSILTNLSKFVVWCNKSLFTFDKFIEICKLHIMLDKFIEICQIPIQQIYRNLSFILRLYLNVLLLLDKFTEICCSHLSSNKFVEICHFHLRHITRLTNLSKFVVCIKQIYRNLSICQSSIQPLKLFWNR